MGFIICCDFDGTVTTKDTIVSIMKRFVPDESAPIIRQILADDISVQEGVTRLFALIPTALKEDIIDYAVNEIPVRQGFQELLDFARAEDIPFYIVSGGMHFFIDPILSRFRGVTEVFANDVDMSGDYMAVNWSHPCDEACDSQACGTCKPSILRAVNHEASDVIVIGDSLTDRLAAHEAALLFTTDKLTDYAEAHDLAFYPFETFDDITIQLKEVMK
ncbi:MtnX-like HAD-IB family phosphatase [Macrococcus equipercicus]|uniref:2-hydroxy-3-keto-5-methylthiopentenyl-1-phosphate phosphatase n=1 Tax=Macrococcus equipercicus TaxID=69967 RepID=A0A9Q9F1J7_9STAP|nr:MtnX-like HAD-IB family phosphatase [Macrococcus equipercicus]UTH14143.1 MtnX-like HAD-IB family phosphatase [Macrococcus equipercicus]